MSLLDIAHPLDMTELDELNRNVPGFDYHRVRTSFHSSVNIVGHQQRSFIVHWCIKEHDRTKGIGLDIGCGQQISPYCIGTDFYAGHNHPQYGGAYWPHIRCIGETLPFRDNTFDFIVSTHSLEHMRHTVSTLKEWLRILKHGCKIIIVMPDPKYGKSGDKGHVHEYTAEQFIVLLNSIPGIKVLEHDTLHNDFSCNTLIEKI